MKSVLLVLGVIIGLIMQSTYPETFKVMGLKPDLVLLLVLFYAVQQGPKKGAVFGFFAGLIQDIFAAKFLGANTIIKGLIGLSSGTLEKRVYKENVFVPAFISIFATYIQEAGYIVMRQLGGYLTKADIPFLKSVSALAIFHFMLAVIGYYIYNKLAEKDILPRSPRRY